MKATIHAILLDLRATVAAGTNGWVAATGICDCVLNDDRVFYITHEQLSELRDLLKALMAKWPKAQDDIRFPIKGGVQAYDKAVMDGTMWDKTTEYGRLRHELLEFLIKETT
jgi:hypothetical protein